MTELAQDATRSMLWSIVYNLANTVVDVLEEEHAMFDRARARIFPTGAPVQPKYRFWDVLIEAQRHHSKWGHDLHRPEGKCLFHSNEETLRNPYLVDRLELGSGMPIAQTSEDPAGFVTSLEVKDQDGLEEASSPAIIADPHDASRVFQAKQGRYLQAHLIQPRVCEQYINGSCGIYAFHHSLRTFLALSEDTLEEAGLTLARGYTMVSYHYTERVLRQFLVDFANRLKRSSSLRWSVFDEQTLMLAELDRQEQALEEDETSSELDLEEKSNPEYWNELPYPWDEESVGRGELERGHMRIIIDEFDLAALPGLKGAFISVPDLSKDELAQLAHRLDSLEKSMTSIPHTQVSPQRQRGALFVLAGCTDHWNSVILIREHGSSVSSPSTAIDPSQNIYFELVVSDSRNAPLLTVTPFHLHRRIQRYLIKDDMEFEAYLRERLHFEKAKLSQESETKVQSLVTERSMFKKKPRSAPYPVSAAIYFASRAATFRLLRAIIAMSLPAIASSEPQVQQVSVPQHPSSPLEPAWLTTVSESQTKPRIEDMASELKRARHEAEAQGTSPDLKSGQSTLRFRSKRVELSPHDLQLWLSRNAGATLAEPQTTSETNLPILEFHAASATLQIRNLLFPLHSALQLMRVDTADLLKDLLGLSITRLASKRECVATFLYAAKELTATLRAAHAATRLVYKQVSERIANELVTEANQNHGTSLGSADDADIRILRSIMKTDTRFARALRERAMQDAGHQDPLLAVLLDRAFVATPYLASPIRESIAPLWPLNILPAPRPFRHVLAPAVICLLEPGLALPTTVPVWQQGQSFDEFVLRRLAHAAAVASHIEIRAALEDAKELSSHVKNMTAEMLLPLTSALVTLPSRPSQLAYAKKALLDILKDRHKRDPYSSQSYPGISQTDVSPNQSPVPFSSSPKTEDDSSLSSAAVADLSTLGAETCFYRTALTVQAPEAASDDMKVASISYPYIVGGVRCLDHAPVLFWPTQNTDEQAAALDDAVKPKRRLIPLASPQSPVRHGRRVSLPTLPERTESGQIIPSQVFYFEEAEGDLNQAGSGVHIPDLPELPPDLPPLRRNPSLPIASSALRAGPLFADWAGADIACIGAWAHYSRHQLEFTLSVLHADQEKPVGTQDKRPSVLRIAAVLSLVAMFDLAPVPVLIQSLFRGLTAAGKLPSTKEDSSSIWAEVRAATCDAIAGFTRLLLGILSAVEVPLSSSEADAKVQMRSILADVANEISSLAAVWSAFQLYEYESKSNQTPEHTSTMPTAASCTDDNHHAIAAKYLYSARGRSRTLAFLEYLVDRSASERQDGMPELLEADEELLLLIPHYLSQWYPAVTLTPNPAMVRSFTNLERLLTVLALLLTMLS